MPEPLAMSLHCTLYWQSESDVVHIVLPSELNSSCYLHQGGYVFAFVCLSVSRITQKVMHEF